MESETEEPICSRTKIIDESLESIFTCIKKGDLSEAVHFIRSLGVDSMPSKKVLRTVIFEILMKSDDVRCLAYASDYLITVLNAFPPTTEDMRQYYYDSIRDSQGYLNDLWTLFNHIVNSFLYHRSIYDIEESENKSEPIKYPNCKFLLEFYVKLFSVDFDYLYIQNYNPCLLMKLLWPNNICLSNRTEMLLKWINDIYSNSLVNTMGDLLECLHEMLTLMVKCFLQAAPLALRKAATSEKFNVSEVVAFRHPSLSEVVEATGNFCKNAFTNQENVKLFLTFLSLKCFQVRVSERIIKQLTRQVSKRTYVLTLNDIVNQCMFPQKFNKRKNKKQPMVKEKNLRKRLYEKEKKTSSASSDKKRETTEIHELVKKDKFADLYQALRTSPGDINAKDDKGSTPLHLACEAGKFFSAKVLLAENGKGSIPKLDFTATDSGGLTALHLTVKANHIEIAKALLSAGGSDLANVTDSRGFKPGNWSSSKEMEKLLQEHQSETKSDESDNTNDGNLTKEGPILKSFKDYSIYLHALTCLLGNYCEMFNVYEYRWKGADTIPNHAEKACCHFMEEGTCSEDAAIIPQMPDLINVFLDSVQKNAQKLEINLDIELIPLKAFAASLIPS